MKFVSGDDLHIAVHRKKLENLYSLWGVIDAIVVAVLTMIALRGQDTTVEIVSTGIIIISHIIMRGHFSTVDRQLERAYQERLAAGQYSLQWWNELDEKWSADKNEKLKFYENFTFYIGFYCSAITEFLGLHIVVAVAVFYCALRATSSLGFASGMGIMLMGIVFLDYYIFKKLIKCSFENHTYKRPL